MPIYEYKCHTCGKEFEIMQRITEEPLKKCPVDVCTCEKKGEGLIERKISKNIGLVFNGKGFYLTDYVHKNTSRPSSSNGSAKHNTEISTSTVETKTETKTENKKADTVSK